MKSILDCSVCVGVPQEIQLDYEEHAVRLPALVGFEIVTTVTENETDAAEAWWRTSTLRCRECGTSYLSVHSRDEGHSFMDPTHDEEHVTRVAATDTRAVRDLETMLLEQRAPSWHLQKHAIESVMDACLATGDRERLVKTLLRHADPVVRLEAAYDLLIVACTTYKPLAPRPFAKELKSAAVEMFGGEDGSAIIVGVLEGVLAAPARETFEYQRGGAGGRYKAMTTHRLVATAMLFVPKPSPKPKPTKRSDYLR